KGRADAALHHLLALGADETDADHYRMRLEALAKREQVTWTDEPPVAAGEVPAPPMPRTDQVRRFTGRISDHWRLTSYTGLTRELEHPRAEHFEPAELPAFMQPVAQYTSIHGFPRGAAAGICLHSIFERIDYRLPFRVDDDMLRAQLGRHGFDPGWAAVLGKMVDQTLQAPLA